MKPVVSVFLFLLLFFTTLPAVAERPLLLNRNGAVIQQADGGRRNYTPAELLAQMHSAGSVKPQSLHLPIENSSATNALPEPVSDTVSLSIRTLYSIMGSGIGYNSLNPVDVDSDGIPEIVCAATTTGFGACNFWYILKMEADGKSWFPLWSSPVDAVPISAVRVFDADMDGSDEILIAHDDGTLKILDKATREEKARIRPVQETVKSLFMADADNDGEQEILLGTEHKTVLIKPGTLEVKFVLNIGADAVKTGNTQKLEQNELVFSSGLVYVLKDSTATELWNYGIIASLLDVADVDGDSLQEIILVEQDKYAIAVLDASEKNTKYTLNTELNIDALLVTDVNYDGKNELLYGDGQWGSLYCIDPVSQSIRWQINNPEHGVTAMAVFDANHDGKNDLIWSAGYSSTGSDYLFVFDLSTSGYLWKSEDVTGPFNAVVTGDADNDGKQDIVTVSFKSESSFESGVLMIFDAETNQRKWRSSGSFLKDTWKGVRTVEISDLNDDGKNEIIIAAENVDKGMIWIVDGEMHTIRDSCMFDLPAFRSMCVNDVDADGKKEIVVVDEMDNLHIINPANWQIKQTVAVPSSYFRQVIRSSDLNNDGVCDIVLCSNVLTVIDGRTGVSQTLAKNHFSSLDIFDWNNDGNPDILAGNDEGHLIVFDGISLGVIADYQPENTSVDAVRGLKAGSLYYLIYSTGSRIGILQKNASVVRSQILGEELGAKEGLRLFDTKNNSTDLLIGSSNSVQRLHLDFLNVSTDSLTVSSDYQETDSVVIQEDTRWQCTSVPSWLTVNPSSGKGGVLTISYRNNPEALRRVAYLKVNAENRIPFTVRVTQKGINPVLVTSSDTLRLGFLNKLSQTIQVTANLPWSARTYAGWLSVKSGSNEYSDAVLVVAQPNNNVQQREASVLISAEGITKVVRVIQSGSSPFLEVEDRSRQIEDKEGSSITLPVISNLHWYASCNQDWLTFSKLSGTSGGNVVITAQQNPTVFDRKAEIRFYANGVADVVVDVTQLKGQPYLQIDKSVCTIDSTNDGTFFSIQSNVSWEIESTSDWLNISCDTGSMDAKIMVTAEPNITDDVRLARLLIKGENTENQFVEILQVKYEFAAIFNKDDLLLTSDDNSTKVFVRNLMANSLLSVYDYNGRLKSAFRVRSATFVLDISSYPQGVYILKYQEGKTIKSGRFIKR